MSALRKPFPAPPALSEAEKEFWRQWVKSLGLKPMGPHEPVNRDRTGFDAWGVR
jgi:hypothetical protein